MAQKIYFGNVEVLNLKTREKRTLEKQLFKENDKPTDTHLRACVLRHVYPKLKKHWRIVKLCFGTAKHVFDFCLLVYTKPDKQKVKELQPTLEL